MSIEFAGVYSVFQAAARVGGPGGLPMATRHGQKLDTPVLLIPSLQKIG
jgi:hypothetical protein